MEKIYLEEELKEQVIKKINHTKEIVLKQTSSLEHILINKIADNFDIDKNRLQTYFTKMFTVKVLEEIDNLFKIYYESELEFYNKNLKTADLIFNSLTEKRTQTIYLDNIIKKIEQKESNKNDIFDRPINEETSINLLFNDFVSVIAKNPKLTIDDSDDLRKMANHYYQLYTNDVKTIIEQCFESNKSLVISRINTEMDEKGLRNGKTSQIVKVEKSIMDNSLNVMNQILSKIIERSKQKAVVDLKECSSTVVDLIFKLLPIEYQEQRGLLEIIVDTNINERLGNLLDSEINKLSDNLSDKNKDKIGNELYEEKRYKNIDGYKCNFDDIEKVYKDVLHEIVIAYDIPEEEQQLKRLNLILMSESNSTKAVFQETINYISFENEKALKIVISEMNRLSEKAHIENKKDSSSKK